MKVRMIKMSTARSDGRPGETTGVTIGKEYQVAEILDKQYSIINDDMKIARYSKIRFEVTDPTPVEPLRDAFNFLTLPMRQLITELSAQNAELRHQLKAPLRNRYEELERELAEIKFRMDGLDK